jgi:hypothetical protein
MTQITEPARHDPVVFLHVMKCGGTSVRAGLSRAIGGDADHPIFELQGQAVIGVVGGRHADNWQFRNRLLHYLLLGPRPSLVLGHFRYRNEYDELLGAAHFVTVLRDPLERFVSLYKYRRHKDTVDVPVSGSFEQFLETPRWQKQGHVYVTTFSGRDDLDPHSEEAIEQTISNLGRFAVVGDITNVGSFCDGVAAIIKKPVEIPRFNPSPSPAGSGSAEIDPESLARAREICAPDQAVYDAVFGPDRGS